MEDVSYNENEKQKDEEMIDLPLQNEEKEDENFN